MMRDQYLNIKELTRLRLNLSQSVYIVLYSTKSIRSVNTDEDTENINFL